ncbi:hypothetical protein Rmet_6503 [Cupriavidus metallidurans CH34]|uniref:Uncharacterized protein n=1 Tax=Cupriavidus metallidurans (strain ATCC 43123 / DSM 2839 / NBRC 102507 / CH34) TaxID=266264 RepID=D3DXU1_CUPMC|nr:hypothetical protein Rmet_6503 [Cupriavidus metallidurans CH34]
MNVCGEAIVPGSANVCVLCELPNAAQPEMTAAARTVKARLPVRAATPLRPRVEEGERFIV